MRIEHIFNTMYTRAATLKTTPIERAAPGKPVEQHTDAPPREESGRVLSLENDTEFLALLVLAMAQELEEQGLLDADRLLGRMRKLDTLDGRADRKLDVDIVRDSVDPETDVDA